MTEAGPGLERARKLAERADQLYPFLAKSAAKRVVRWEWATFTRYSLEPLYFELHMFLPGVPLESEPDPELYATGHGFDSDGNLIVELDQTGEPGQYSETYYVYEDDGVATYYFSYEPDHPWLSVKWMSLDGDGRVSRIDSVAANGNFWSESFEYDKAGRLACVRRQGINPPHPDMDDLREIEYDDEGNVDRTIWVHSDGTRAIDYERPRPERSLATWRERLRTILKDAIVEALCRAAPESPVYAVALWLCVAEYQHRLPPNVAFATERDLERFRAERPGDFKHFAWQPAEWKDHLSLEVGDELMTLCDSVNQDIWQNELDEEVDALLREVASLLSRTELPVTRSEMFVAYLTNVEEDPIGDISRTATPEAMALLSERGLL